MPLSSTVCAPQLLPFSECSVTAAMDVVGSFPRVPSPDASPTTSGEPIILSSRNCAAVTEVDLTPWFSRMSCSFISSREEEEKTRKRSCGSAR